MVRDGPPVVADGVGMRVVVLEVTEDLVVPGLVRDVLDFPVGGLLVLVVVRLVTVVRLLVCVV